MTWRNIPITIGFSAITVSQLALGVCLMSLTVRDGGRANLSQQKTPSHRAIISLVTIVPRLVEQMPHIPLDAYHLCICAHARHRTLGIAVISTSLLYGARNGLEFGAGGNAHTDDAGKPDVLMFFLIIFWAIRWKGPGCIIPGILGTMAEDATQYFLVIFSSHLSLTMTLAFGRVRMIILLSGS